MRKLKVHAFDAADEKKIPMLADSSDIVARIREQAYRLFTRRGFDQGHALDDWLAAERQVVRPTTELRELSDGYRLKVALPGFRADDIHVASTPNELFVRAGIELAAAGSSESPPALWTEFYAGAVYRHTALPRQVDAGKVTANLENGILEVVAPFPKTAGVSAKKTTKKKTTKKKSTKKSAAKKPASRPTRASKKKSKKKPGKKTAKKSGKR